jgi:hypothetical protein
MNSLTVTYLDDKNKQTPLTAIASNFRGIHQMARHVLHGLRGARRLRPAPQTLIIFSSGDQGKTMDKFTQDELDHLFVAMLLHTKTTREEQAAWVSERAEIWRKLVAASDSPASDQTIYRTNLFNCPEQLRRFWKSPDEIEKAFTLPLNTKAKTKRAGR